MNNNKNKYNEFDNILSGCKTIVDAYYFGDIYKNTSKKSLLAKNIGLMFKQYLYKNKIAEYKGYMDNKKIYCIFEIK